MTMAMREQEAVARHYGSADLVERIEAALQGAGVDPEGLTREDVAALEEFHIGGRQATRELAEMAGFRSGERVLDLGAGLGGPARTLAAEHGCRVVALELTGEFCRVARWLNDRLGFSEAVEVRQGSALSTAYPDGSFDGVMLEHMTMNIPDKGALFDECRRVLRAGGRLALYEICAGDGEVLFPVPWADGPSLSYLVAPEALRELAEASGLRTVAFEDVTEVAMDRMQAMLGEISAGHEGDGPAVTLDLVIGDRSDERGANVLRSLSEGRVRVVRGVMEVPTRAA